MKSQPSTSEILVDPTDLSLLDIVGLPEPAGGAPVILSMGRVSSAGDDGRLDIVCAGVTVTASVGLGCLIQPAPGDLVLLARINERAYVLTVLERPGSEDARLTLPGQGALTVESDTLVLKGRRRLSIGGEAVDLKSRLLTIVGERTTWLGKALSTVVDRWHLSTRSHEAASENMVVTSGNRITTVKEVDMLKTNTLTVTVSGIASETAKSKVVAVGEDLRMDGKRITMG